MELLEALASLAIFMEQLLVEERRESYREISQLLGALEDSRHSSSAHLRYDTSPKTVTQSSEWTLSQDLAVAIAEMRSSSQSDG